MAPVVDPPAPAVGSEAIRLNRADGVELLGPVSGSGYREGAALVRRADGQMVHLGPLMYGLLQAVDGERDHDEVAAAMSERLGRRLEAEHVVRLAEKLSAQGLLAGSEHRAPPRRNPLLALRWKVLVTNPTVTRRLTAPFTVLFSPWIMVPALIGFGIVFWFVLIHKGVAAATADAFRSPGMLLLVFVLAVASAGFHELGHASACRYGGGTPGGMGMGLYLVWPAFYTDVTDAYRLSKRARLRTDLGGLYFNTIVADLTLALWLVWRSDALLLLVALQVLEMVKQLSPVIRADGYHILSDATGVPDLYSHMGPTLRRLLPGHRHEPSALSGWARAFVCAWVLVIVPVLISLSASAILLLPHLMTSAFDSGCHIVDAIPHQASAGQILDLLASVLRLLALALPVLGSVLVTQKVVRTMAAKAGNWSRGRAPRQAVVGVATAGLIAALAWAWWPSGQYQPVRASQNGTIGGMLQLVSAPGSAVRPSPAPATVPAQPVHLAPGTHLAVSMIPVGGVSRRHPALFIIPGGHGRPSIAVISTAPGPSSATDGSAATGAAPTGTTATTATTSSVTASAAPSRPATIFPFRLPAGPPPGGTQALAVNTTDGGVLYNVAYSLVTVGGNAPVSQSNSAYALADCHSCTTVAVSFQVVLVVGQHRIIDPSDIAGSLNANCPACSTTAIADQIVVTLKSQPTQTLVAKLEQALQQLNALPSLGAAGTPTAVAAQVARVQQQIDDQLAASGLLTNPAAATSTTPTGTTASSTATTSSSATTPSSPPASSGSPTSTSPGSSPSSGSPPAQTSTTQTSTAPVTTTAPAATTPAGSSAGAGTAAAPATTTTAATTTSP